MVNMKQMCSSPINALAPFNQAVQAERKALLPLLSNEASIALNSIRMRYNAAILLYWSKHTPLGYRTAVQMFARQA